MQYTLIALTARLLAPRAALHAAHAPAKPAAGKPNIIVILTDGQRWDAAGFASGGTAWSP